MRFVVFTLALLSPNAIAAQAEAAPTTLKPTSSWVLDYGESGCRIVRTFSAVRGDDESILLFEQRDPAQSLSWLIAGHAVPDRRKVSIQFGPDNQPVEADGRAVSFGKFDRALMGSEFRPVPLEALAAVLKEVDKGRSEKPREQRGSSGAAPGAAVLEPPKDFSWVDIEPGTDRAIRIPVGDMAPIHEAMKTCMDDLVRSWGLEPEVQAQVVEPPEWTNLAAVAQGIQRHYPSKAYERGEQATMEFRIMIEADGTPSKCVRTDVTKADNFDNTACLEILKEGVFNPARDATGKPLRSYFIQRVRYVMMPG